MRKAFLLALLIGICLTGISQEKMNKLSINPIQLFGYNLINFEYERGFSDGKLGVSFFFTNTGDATRVVNGYRMYLTEQNVSIKRYLNSVSTSSFWYGGQLSVASGNIYYDYNFDEDYNEEEYEKYKENRATNIGTLGLVAKLGYQFVIKSFYIDLFAGGGYALTNNLFGNAKYSGELEETKILFTYGMKIGIVF